ncbi:MAG: class I SAM-dependent methyltransferase [Candidatus Hodarchaeales archaeon]
MLKLNLGGGPKIIPGFVNVDALDWNGITEVVLDLTKIPYPWKDESAEEIVAQEVLEHISFKKTLKVLKEWYRILKKGGKLTIQVPDIGKMCEYYVNGQVCGCVPRKAKRIEDFKANPDCWICGGKAKINTTRWIYAFTGAQKHSYDYHRNVFTKEILKINLIKAGFQKIQWKDNIYKLIAICYK